MGNSRYSDVDWTAHTARSYSGKTRDQIFTSASVPDALNPAKINHRECRDSAANPNATPIILGSDVTGSMGRVAEQIIKTELGKVFSMLYDRKPVPDPQIMCAATGDSYVDRAPLQVTQFEADGVALAKQLEQVYLEGGGGGNAGETYPLLWAFAAYRTKVDAFKKRGRKGYIFTIGDEAPLPVLKRDHLVQFVGLTDAQSDMDASVLLRHAQGDWHIFHLIVNPVDHQPVVREWKALLNERAILLPNLDNLATGITAVIDSIEGADASRGKSGKDLAVVRDVTAQLTAV